MISSLKKQLRRGSTKNTDLADDTTKKTISASKISSRSSDMQASEDLADGFDYENCYGEEETKFESNINLPSPSNTKNTSLPLPNTAPKTPNSPSRNPVRGDDATSPSAARRRGYSIFEQSKKDSAPTMTLATEDTEVLLDFGDTYGDETDNMNMPMIDSFDAHVKKTATSNMLVSKHTDYVDRAKSMDEVEDDFINTIKTNCKTKAKKSPEKNIEEDASAIRYSPVQFDFDKESGRCISTGENEVLFTKTPPTKKGSDEDSEDHDHFGLNVNLTPMANLCEDDDEGFELNTELEKIMDKRQLKSGDCYDDHNQIIQRSGKESDSKSLFSSPILVTKTMSTDGAQSSGAKSSSADTFDSQEEYAKLNLKMSPSTPLPPQVIKPSEKFRLRGSIDIDHMVMNGFSSNDSSDLLKSEKKDKKDKKGKKEKKQKKDQKSSANGSSPTNKATYAIVQKELKINEMRTKELKRNSEMMPRPPSSEFRKSKSRCSTDLGDSPVNVNEEERALCPDEIRNKLKAFSLQKQADRSRQLPDKVKATEKTGHRRTDTTTTAMTDQADDASDNSSRQTTSKQADKKNAVDGEDAMEYVKKNNVLGSGIKSGLSDNNSICSDITDSQDSQDEPSGSSFERIRNKYNKHHNTPMPNYVQHAKLSASKEKERALELALVTQTNDDFGSDNRQENAHHQRDLSLEAIKQRWLGQDLATVDDKRNAMRAYNPWDNIDGISKVDIPAPRISAYTLRNAVEFLPNKSPLLKWYEPGEGDTSGGGRSSRGHSRKHSFGSTASAKGFQRASQRVPIFQITAQ